MAVPLTPESASGSSCTLTLPASCAETDRTSPIIPRAKAMAMANVNCQPRERPRIDMSSPSSPLKFKTRMTICSTLHSSRVCGTVQERVSHHGATEPILYPEHFFRNRYADVETNDDDR